MADPNETPNWTKVLLYMYKNEISNIEIPGGGKSVSETDDIVGESTGLTRKEVEDSILYLLETDLLIQGSGKYVLTNDGFSVAHERWQDSREVARENNRVHSQNRINRAIGFLTLGLLFVSYTGTVLSSIANPPVPVSVVAGLVIETIVVFVLSYLLYDTGLLEEQEEFLTGD